MRFSHALILALEATSFAYAAKKPNVVFILTDDQDVHMNSMDYMPRLKQYMIDEGTIYTKHFWYFPSTLIPPTAIHSTY